MKPKTRELFPNDLDEFKIETLGEKKEIYPLLLVSWSLTEMMIDVIILSEFHLKSDDPRSEFVTGQNFRKNLDFLKKSKS